MKILCVGCSFTDGWVTGIKDVTETYPYFLKTRIDKKNVEVMNLGVGGFSNIWIYKTMKDAIKNYQPDIVVRQITTPLRFGVYDVNKKWNLAQNRYVEEWEPGFKYLLRWPLYEDSNIFTPTTKLGGLYNKKQAEKIHKHHFAYTNPDIMMELNEAVLHAGDATLEGIKSFTFSWFERDVWKGCPSVETEIAFPKRYLVDAAGHFNKTGNIVLANWVLENIKHWIEK